MSRLFQKPLVLKGYQFRRHTAQKDVLLFEIRTTSGEVPIAMSKKMVERLVQDLTAMAAKLSDVPSSARASDHAPDLRDL